MSSAINMQQSLLWSNVIIAGTRNKRNSLIVKFSTHIRTLYERSDMASYGHIRYSHTHCHHRKGDTVLTTSYTQFTYNILPKLHNKIPSQLLIVFNSSMNFSSPLIIFNLQLIRTFLNYNGGTYILYKNIRTCWAFLCH